MRRLSSSLQRNDFVWALGSLCQIHQIPFDPNLVFQQFPPPYTIAALQDAAKDIGFEVSVKEAVDGPLVQRELPCLAFVKPSQADDARNNSVDDALSASDANSEVQPHSDDEQNIVSLALVVKVENDKTLYFPAGTDTPETLSIAEFAEKFEPWHITFQPKEEVVPDDDITKEPSKFGFKWFIPELFRHKKVWRDVVLASLAIQLVGLATPLFTQVVIDKVIVHHTMNTLIVIGVGLFMFMVFSAVMTWARQYLVLHTGNRIDAVLGHKVFKHLFELPMRYFEHRTTGTLVARMQGVETIRQFISGAAITLILDFPFLFIFLGIMFYYSWELTTVVLVTLTLISILSLSITPTLRKRLNDQFQLGARNQAFLIEYVSGMETVKSLQMEPQLKNRYGDYLSSYLGSSFKTQCLSNAYNVSANTLEQFQTLAILCYGAWLVMTTDYFTIGMLVAFQMFASRLSGPVLRMVGLWQEFQQANIAVKRLGDIMDAPTEPYAASPTRGATGKGSIDINNLSFRYSDDLPYLYRDLSLTIQPGNCIAIMGPSGSGKSTLTKLLQGFYLPNDGQILIDQRDIRHLSANELRNYFGVVPQETLLFSGTVYENLIMANPHANFEQVIRACQMAEMHDVIERLPKGYQTEIGEHGAGLSGGQKQRLAIARALLKQPKILVFDEATSHLDHATAEHFAKTVNTLKGKVTILFITHQLPKGLKVDDAVILGTKQDEVSKQNKDMNGAPSSTADVSALNTGSNTNSSTEGSIQK